MTLSNRRGPCHPSRGLYSRPVIIMGCYGYAFLKRCFAQCITFCNLSGKPVDTYPRQRRGVMPVNQTPTKEIVTMSIAENKALVRRYFDERWNHGNLDVIDELLAPSHDLEQAKAGVRAEYAAFGG